MARWCKIRDLVPMFMLAAFCAVLYQFHTFSLTNNCSCDCDFRMEQQGKSNVEDIANASAIKEEVPTGEFPVIMNRSHWLERLGRNEIKPVAFEPWNKSYLPCYPPSTPNLLKDYTKARFPSEQGFLFVKPVKTGGSTAAGLNLRIAANVAERLHKKGQFLTSDNTTNEMARQNDTLILCDSRWDHTHANRLIGNRDPNRSFAWTIMREPTKRAVSHFFHFEVSREFRSTTDESFQHFLLKDSDFAFKNFYAKYLTIQRFDPKVRGARKVLNDILLDYDLIAITERMDESAVALSMLLDLPLGDVMFVNAKSSGGYDDGMYLGECFFIHRSFVSPGMREFFEDRPWRETVFWDTLLYHAANISLDLTIDRLGRERFENKLSIFRRAQQVAMERCSANITLPCSPTGKRRRRNETSCLWSDSACGHECLKQVANELDI